MQILKDEIEKLTQCDQSQLNEIFDNLQLVLLKKGEFLLKEGQICEKYFFIENGAVRLYYIKDEKDYTVWIGTAGQIFTDLESYLSLTKSRLNIEAIEPTTAYTINKTQSDVLVLQSNVYNTLLRKTIEIAFVNLSKNVISFQSDEAAERYQRIEVEKNWLSQYPLRYISSFIGITQSSLSRLRAKKV